MIKVKGQLGEMAKCLEDPDPRISDLAKLFFKELSTKDNALYNNLQDVISHLSVGKFKVDEESFEKTMRFIFTFIEKVGDHSNPIYWLRLADDVGQAG
jgi:condensin complex subunit 1